jgi:formyl-CoA transferase
MFAPLTGLRVIDITQVLAGPYCTYQLGLLGAEVLKIELPGTGDWTRAGGADAELASAQMGMSFLTQNANKKSVTINVKKPAGVALLKRLIADAAVFVENFKPGTAAGLGLSYDDVRALNPALVYCSISAYGQDGPIGHRPAYDHIIQGMSGIMTLTGTPETVPNKVGSPYIDYATGLNAAFAVLAALHEVHRTGQGQRVDVAMLDTSMLLMASLMSAYLTLGKVPQPAGNEAFSGSPSSGTYETTDGLVMLAANNERQYIALCQAIGRPELATDPRWATPAARKQHIPALRTEMAATFATKSAADWEQILEQASVPAVRVRTLAEVLDEAQLAVRGLTTALPLPNPERTVRVPTLGFKVNGEVTPPTVPPPQLGEHTEAVLRGLGLTERELQELRTAGVIAPDIA